MALIKETVLDRMEILSNGYIQIRWAKRIKDEATGKIEAQTYHREVRKPGQDLADLPTEFKAAAQAIHTPAVVSAYNQYIIDRNAND